MEFDVMKVCRLCLKPDDVLCSIFETLPGLVPLQTRIMSCAGVRLYEGDGLPPNVCTGCVTQVDRSYQFRLLCETSDSALRSALSDIKGSDSSENGDLWDMTKFTPENLNGNEQPVDFSVSQENKNEQSKIQEQPAKSRRCRGGDKLFKCRQCNKSYSFSSALSRHKAVHNTTLRPHVCHICNKGFAHLDKLARHQKTHSMDVFIACENCRKPFKTNAAYQKHRVSNNCNIELAQCQYCSMEICEDESHVCSPHMTQQPLEQQTSSNDPQDKRSKGRPEFQCDVCYKNFATKGSLEVHSTIHTGVRPFVCSVCQKSFRHKVNLMEHFQRKHSQVRPYICDICAARFVTKQELVRHYRKHIGD